MDEKEKFLEKKQELPLWLVFFVAIITLISLFFNLYLGVIGLPTNIVTIAEGLTTEVHTNLSEIYVSEIGLDFDGKYATYYVEWKIQDISGKSSGFEQVEKCDRLGYLNEDKRSEKVECKIKFDKYSDYKITANAYYVVDDIKIRETTEKIDWLLEKGEKSFPWIYEVYVKDE